MSGTGRTEGRRRWFGPRHPYWLALGAFVIAYVVLRFVSPVEVETYKQLRGSLFTGLFAVSGFLLSAKSLVILNMKKEVYAEEWYLDRLHRDEWEQTEDVHKRDRASRESCKPNKSVFLQLSQIGSLLTVNIGAALVASFLQITVGLAEKCWAVEVCMSAAFATATLLGCSVYWMWRNFEQMYADWEKVAQGKLEARWAASLDAYHNAAVKPTQGSLPKVKTVGADDELPQP